MTIAQLIRLIQVHAQWRDGKGGIGGANLAMVQRITMDKGGHVRGQNMSRGCLQQCRIIRISKESIHAAGRCSMTTVCVILAKRITSKTMIVSDIARCRQSDNHADVWPS